MSEQFDMLVWRANGVDMNGDILTPTALAMMADALLPGQAITFNFDFRNVVGKIIQAYVKNNELRATVVVTDCDVIEDIRKGKAALRPGFSIGASHLSDDGHRVIEQVGEAYSGLMTNAMPLPSVRICELCARTIPDNGKLPVCGPCLVGMY